MLHPIEAASSHELGALVDEKLTALVALAKARSPFYQARLAGLDVNGRADLAHVPVLDKDAWMAASPPHSESTLTRPLGGAYIFRSGGSTGEPKFSAFAGEEFRAFVSLFLRSYHAVGLRPGDRVANLFACGSLYASFVFVNRMLEEMGTLNFPFTAATSPEAVARHVKLFGINTLVGFPSWILQVAEVLVAEGLTIEKVFYAGEHLYDEERRYLREQLGVTVIGSAGYAAVDTGLIGYQCAQGEGSVHHVLADHTHLEIVNPDTHAPVGPGEDGLLLVTNLDRALQPVIRYNIGDLGRWVEGDCACGRTAPRFELLRRGDDVLRIGYANVTYDEVARAFATVPELTSTIQMVKEREERRDRLRFRIEVREPDGIDAAVMGDRLTAALSAAKPDVGKLLAAGYLHPIAYEFLPLGAIPRLPVTGKFKRTLDLSQ
ncbi:MAG: phenylacetate--CoA ligase family protein [Candidatus Sericytochromatia bacterium]